MTSLSSHPETLRAELRDGVLWLTKINAAEEYGMSLAMLAALDHAFHHLVSRPDVKGVVIDAQGEGRHQGAVMVRELRAARGGLGAEDVNEIVDLGQALGARVAACPKPVIGLIRGGARGGGLEILLRCDFLYTLEEAEFSLPEVTLGFVAAWGGVQWSSRLMPRRRAQEVLLLGDIFSGREAADWGLVSRAFATNADLEAHLSGVLTRLDLSAPVSFAQTKAALTAVWESSFSGVNACEKAGELVAMLSQDASSAADARGRGHFHNFRLGTDGPRRPPWG